MKKTLQIALREFLSTVGTKGFIIGTLIFPAIMIVAITIIPRLIDDKPPRYVGNILVLDPTGWTAVDGVTLTQRLASLYTPEALAADYARLKEGVKQQASERMGEVGAEAAAQALEQQLGEVPEINVVALQSDADIEAEKARLLSGTAFDGSDLAIVVLDPRAVVPGPDGSYGAYTAYVRKNIDDRFQGPLRQKLAEIIRAARIEAADMDAAQLAAINTVNAGRPIEVTDAGERESAGGEVQIFLAMGFMMLLWASVMTGGQYLMTTVITEKSNRVMEVLLSAVSPRQLMTGKIIGQMGVALAVLGVYVTIGVVALQRFGYLDVLEASSLGLVVVYFFIAFFLFATLMAAIGSAVTEVVEAQSLLTPVMMVLIIPWILFMPLTRNPNSAFATIMGFLPPISPFAMVIREAGSDPVPIWQHAVSIAIGIASVLLAVWATSKIFRIGVLMYGKPPNFRTLVKWVRMA